MAAVRTTIAKKTDASLRDISASEIRKNPGCTVYQCGPMSSMFRIGTHGPSRVFAKLSPSSDARVFETS
jgi:hypothetical protein